MTKWRLWQIVRNITEPIAPEQREPIAMNHIKSSSCGFEVAVVLKTSIIGLNNMLVEHVHQCLQERDVLLGP